MKHERRRPRSHDSPPLSSVVVAGKDPGFLDSSGSIEVGVGGPLQGSLTFHLLLQQLPKLEGEKATNGLGKVINC